MKEYNPKDFEKKWQDAWAAEGVYETKDSGDNFYILDMFPYPSGAALHVGHPKGYIATDVYSRMMRMKGKNVLHPMGWDAFGLPAEQFAIKNKIHPKVAVDQNVARFKDQLQAIGFDYDWSREVNTTDPEYFKWTQWAFVQMHKAGLTYQSNDPINWCPECKTGLANEDLEDGKCERCGSIVEKKPLRQWGIKITKYADRLLEDLDLLDKWPESVKTSQRNWIGKKEGSNIDFKIKAGDKEESLTVFTTRADTLFGCTYVVLAPEHGLVHRFEGAIENMDEVKSYIESIAHMSDLDRQQNKEKTGVQLQGVTATNPANGEEVPVWVADYVLASFGTGAVMAVPAHDERDFEFAKNFDLPMVEVISGGDVSKEAFVGYGTLMNSGEFDGVSSEEARVKITEKVGGEIVTNYRLQDWTFSRQRYWGEPIPIVFDSEGAAYPLAESELPLRLPEVESYEPTGTGESPLAGITDWVNVKGKIVDGEFVTDESGEEFRRETNTMPQWAGSSWYYLRYMDPKNDSALVDGGVEKDFMPVDVYVGGVEHATRHLIYARFWHKFLFDIKAVSTKEPFMELHSPGLILAEDGRKMSKRWGNTINPDEMVDRFGADSFRLYEMFMGPFENTVAWNTDGVVGTRRFVEKVWRIANQDWTNLGENWNSNPSTLSLLHKTIKKVEEDIRNFKFNTAISAMMILANNLEGAKDVSKDEFKKFIQILAPFAPHMAEELWREVLGESESVHLASWPEFDLEKIKTDTVEMVIQVNGKVRAKIQVAAGLSKDEVMNLAKADEGVQKWLDGEPKKVIHIQDKLLNIVI